MIVRLTACGEGCIGGNASAAFPRSPFCEIAELGVSYRRRHPVHHGPTYGGPAQYIGSSISLSDRKLGKHQPVVTVEARAEVG